MARPTDNPPQPRSPAPQHDPVFIWPTPNHQDLLFWVEKNGDMPKNQQFSYGDPFPDSVKYPNHKLVYVSPQGPDKWARWYYASARISEDAYNWEMEDAGLTGAKFLQVTRTYLTLRASFNAASPAMGASMPNVPAGKFTGAFVLADRKQIRTSEQEFDALFVAEQLVYIQKEILTDITPDPDSGIGYQKTTTLYYRGESITFGSDTKAIEQWVAAPENVFWGTDANGFARAGNQLTDNWFAITYAKVIDLNTVYEKESNRLRPEKFYCPKLTTKDTTITANNAPGVPSDPVASSGQSVTVGKVGRIQKVTTVTQGGSAQTLKSLTLLSDDGYIYPETEELVASSEVPATRSYINTEGQAVSFNNVDACNAVKATRQAVSLEDAYTKSVQRFIPEKFILNASTASTEETDTGVSGEPAQPSPEDRKRVTIQQKGVVRKTETVEQLGTVTDLKGLSTLDDGYAYPFSQKVVALNTVPTGRTRILGDGTIKEHTPVDANWAIEETKQAVSLEVEYTKQSSRLAPDRFLPTNQKSVSQTTETGVVTEPTTPSVALSSDVTVVQKGAIRKTTTTSQVGSAIPLYGTTVDKRTGETFIESTELVPMAAVIPTEIQADGTVVIYEPVDANWAMKITRRAASTLTKTWTTDIDYEWPTVLLGIQFKIWARKGGAGSAVYPVPRYKKGFYEPQTAVVSQYWQKAAPVIVPRPLMVAEGFTYRCPLYSITVPPCLHKTEVLSCTIGSSDPDWASATDSEIFAATRYTDWPTEIFWRLAEPFLGGYLVTEYTLPRPA